MSEPKKVALVTGGGRGIGRGIALKLASVGYDVAITYRKSVAGAEKVVEQMRAAGSDSMMYQADAANLDEMLTAFKKFQEYYGRIDLLVNNAGITVAGNFLTMKPEQFDYCMNVDLRTPYFLSQKAANLMVEKGTKGVIINISSNQSEEVFPWSSVYGSMKAGLNKLTKHMALELGSYGIRALAVCPGYCDVWRTPQQRTEPNERIDSISSFIPMGRFSTPEEMAALVAFLASDDAGFITGISVMADGGTSLPVATHLLELPIEERKKRIQYLAGLKHEY